MDRGDVGVEELVEHLQGPAWIRACLVSQEGRWRVLYLDAVIGAEPDSWQTQSWVYGEVAFVAFSAPAEQLAAAFSAAGDSSTWNAAELSFSFPATQPRVQWYHYPSYGPRHDWYRSARPSISYQVNEANPGNRQLPPSMLVGSGPSFFDSRIGFNAFFTGDFVNSRDLPPELAHIRCVDSAAWLGPIHVTATELSVQVGGSDVNGAILEVYSETLRCSVAVPESGLQSFALPQGPPTHLWIWLKRGTAWLDYRAITPWTSVDELRAANVQIEVPQEPQAVIEAIIYSGEGPQVEFKRCLPWQGETQPRRPLKTIVAFANGDGGTLVYGVDRDEMTVVGLEVDDPTLSRDRLGQMICSQVTPKPQFQSDYYTIGDKTVLAVRVEAGTSPPYGLTPDSGSRDKPEFYVRRGANTLYAHPSDLRQTVLARLPSESPRIPGFPS